MSCSEMTELMQRHLDHDLTDVEQQYMFSHFNSCPECLSLFERLERISWELEALPAVKPPYSIVDSILPLLHLDKQITREQEIAMMPVPNQQASVVPFMRRKFVSRLVYGSTAAAALVLGVFLFQGIDTGHKNASIINSPAIERASLEVSGASGTLTPNTGTATPDSGTDAQRKMMDDPTMTSLVTPELDNLTTDSFEISITTTMDQFVTPFTDDKPSLKSSIKSTAAGSPFEEESAIVQNDSPSISQPDLGGGQTTSSSGIDSQDKGFLDLSGEGSFAGAGAFAEPAKSSSDNKVFFSPPDTIVQGADNQGFTASNKQLLSTNEKNEAIVENQRVLIRSTLGEIIYLSPTQWAGDDVIHLCLWLNDFQLLYEVEKADGTLPQYIIDIGLKVETKK